MFLRECRKMRGLTQGKLAEMGGVHVNTILRWEYGKREPKASELRKIAEALNVTEAELLNPPSKHEFDVKILIGIKSLTDSAGLEISDDSFIYGIDDSKPLITFSGKIRIDTHEQRKNALDKIIRKFKVTCYLFDKKYDIEAEFDTRH